MKNVAVTGISGYIGDLLLRSLDKRDEVESIIGLDKVPPRSSSPKLKFYLQSVQEPFLDIFVENGVDSAVHLAFVVPPAKDPDEHGVDIHGSWNFLEACRKTSVKNLLYVSSHTVYGPHPDNPTPISEDMPLRPISNFSYSLHKAEADRMFQDFMGLHSDRCVHIVRSCTVVGPSGSSGFNVLLMPVMVRFLGYDPPWQFIHENELVDLILMLLNEKQGGVFNAAGDGSVPYSEVISAAGKLSVPLPFALLSFLLNFSWKLHLQSSSPVGGLEFIKHPIVVSTEKLRRATGFRFNHSSREALISFLRPESSHS